MTPIPEPSLRLYEFAVEEIILPLTKIPDSSVFVFIFSLFILLLIFVFVLGYHFPIKKIGNLIKSNDPVAQIAVASSYWVDYLSENLEERSR